MKTIAIILLAAVCNIACAQCYTPRGNAMRGGKAAAMVRESAAFAVGYWRAKGYTVADDIYVIWDTKIDATWCAWGNPESQQIRINATPCRYTYHRGAPDGQISQHSRALYDFDLDRVMCHELGHLLGVPHSDEPGTIMYPILSMGGGLWRGVWLCGGESE